MKKTYDFSNSNVDFSITSSKKGFFLFAFVILSAILGRGEMNAKSPASEYQEEIEVEGVVTDETGMPMIGVTVIEQGTTNGAQTDFDGNFNITIRPGSVLEISFVGYKTHETDEITEETSLEIELEPDIAGLDEVVVVGYGQQTKESVVAAIDQVEGEEVLRTGSTTTVSDALQGMMPGLTIINSDGLPGKGAHEIQLRGISTTGNNAPLTIVDGIERSFNHLDPNEIESVSILKDASATAIYGVRGANGVIMITTKRGKTGEPQINFSSNFALKSPTKNYSSLDYVTTMEMYNEAAVNDRLWDNIIPETTLNAWRQNLGQAGPYNDYFPHIDWWDELLRDYGTQQQYNLNVRGGTDFMKYFGSIGYVDEGDIFATDRNEFAEFDSDFGFKRYNWRFNFDFDLTRTTEFSIGFAGNNRTRLEPVFGNNVGFILGQLRTAPNNLFPLRYSDGEWGDSPTGGDNFLVLLTRGGQDRYKTFQGFYDATLKQRLNFITQGLSVEGKITLDTNSDYFSSVFTENSSNPNRSNVGTIRYHRRYDYSNPIMNEDGTVDYPLLSEVRFPSEDFQAGRPVQGTFDNFSGYGTRLFYQFSANYNRRFGKHKVSGLALMNRLTETNSGSSVNFPFPTFREDWVGRATYAYDEKYLLEVNGAYTGSEKFAQGKRFGFFPSYSAGWVISREPFVENVAGNWLDFLKVRYSEGEMGSDMGAPRFAYMQMYSTGGNIGFGYDNLTNFGPLYYEGRAANPGQTWETSFKRNLGFELDMFGKFSGTLDLYNERREGILMGLRTVPVWFGAQEPSGNIGETKNRGYELAVNWEDQIGENFMYTLGGNIAQFENQIIFFDDPRLQDDYLRHAGKPIRWDRNAPRTIHDGYYSSLDDIYNAPSANMGQSMGNIIPGDVMFVDYNADGRVDEQDRVVMKDQLYPKTTYGFNLGASFKNFEVQARFYGVTDVGRTIPNTVFFDFDDSNIMAHPDVLERWTPEVGNAAGKPSLHLGTGRAHNTSISTLQYVDGSYLRLRTAEIAYNMNPGFLRQLGVNNVRLYANGNNLYTWVKVDTRLDPEAFGSNSYPVIKRYNFGLRVGF